MVDAFTGPALGHLRPASSSGAASQAGFRIAAGTNYAIRVTSVSGSTFSLKWAAAGAPANDARTAAAAISGSAGSIVTDATAATTQTTDPRIDTLQAPATVWYQWTAPATGVYDFDTHGSLVNTLLGVYTNTTPSTLIADSSGDCGTSFNISTASVQFPATAGTSYLLMVAGTNDSELTPASLGGPLQLNWRQATSSPVASGNDAFASPTRISGNYGSISGNTDGATTEVGEPATAGIRARSSVWFTWTRPPPATTWSPHFRTTKMPAPRVLSLYTGSTLGTLRAVHSSNDDFLMSTLTSSTGINISGGASVGAFGTQVHLFKGTTYRIAADGYSYPGGFTLRWDIPQAAPTIRSVTPGNGSIGVIWSPPKTTGGSRARATTWKWCRRTSPASTFPTHSCCPSPMLSPPFVV